MRSSALIACLLLNASVDAEEPSPSLRLESSHFWVDVAFSPDGKRLATADADGVVCLWDARRGTMQHQVTKNFYLMDGLAFSADGEKLVAGRSGLYQIWNVRDGKKLKSPRFAGKFGTWRLVGFSADDSRVALFNDDEGLRLWNAATGEALPKEATASLRPALHDGTFAVSPDGRHEATLLPSVFVNGKSSHPNIHLKDQQTGNSHPIDGSFGGVAFSPDGRLLAADGGLWDVVSRKQVRRMNVKPPFAFSPDGRYLASWQAPEIIVHEVVSGQEALRLEVRPPFKEAHVEVKRLAFAAGSRSLAAATGKPTPEAKLLKDRFLEDGRTFNAACRGTASVLIWNLTDQHCRQETPEQLWTRLAAGAREAQPALWELARRGNKGVALLDKRLQPAQIDIRLKKLTADLDSAHFATREAAARKLAALGPAAEGALFELKESGSLEVRRRVERLLKDIRSTVPSTDGIRHSRAITALEAIGTPAARRVLEKLAKGTPHAPLTSEARAALARLSARE